MELNEFFKKLNKKKEGMHLSETRKRALKARILYLIKLSEKPKARTASFFFPILRPVPIIAGVLAVALAGGGIAFAAENSLPGDILYTVKINFNENLIAAVKVTQKDKASWQVDKTERRLQEASTLIVLGKADSKNQAEIQNNFEQTSNQAQDSIQSLDNAGNATSAAEVAAKLEAVLKVHQQILSAVQDDEPATSTVMTLQDKLSDKVAKLEIIKTLIQAKIAMNGNEAGVSSDAENGIQKAKNKINSVKKFVENNSDKLSIGAVKDADQDLSEAAAGVEDAQGKLKDNMAGEAFNSANDASEVAQKVQLLLNANINLGIPSGNGASGSTSSTLVEPSTSTPPDSTSTGN
jgi:hypothetical protein